MYRHRYINQHSQFGRTYCTLILEDLEGDMPLVRIDKEFGFELQDLDQEVLFQEARKEIIAAQLNYNQSLALIAEQLQEVTE